MSSQIFSDSDLGKAATERSSKDLIRVKNLLLTASFTDGAQWPPSTPGKPKLQPIHVTLTISHSISIAAATDNLDHSINYSTLSATITELSKSRAFASSEDFIDEAHARCLAQFPGVQEFSITLTRPKALLQPASTEFTSTRIRGNEMLTEIFSIIGMECDPIVGINACEREQAQAVKFDISVRRTTKAGPRRNSFPSRELFLKVLKEVDQSSYLTLEALVSFVADITLNTIGQVQSVTVRGGKPNALSCAEAAEVEITRTQPSSVQAPVPSTGLIQPSNGAHKVAIALGSNLGDRFANVESALRLIETTPSQYRGDGPELYASVVDTSFMYETEPMYVTDQPKFINCACMIETNIAPLLLLKILKDIETAVGRVVSFRNGPRAIDVDILAYDDEVIDTRSADQRSTLDNLAGQLVVPHPRLIEREFVLRPLNDFMPDYQHPVLRRTVNEIFTSLIAAQPTDTPMMNMVTPFPQYPVSSDTDSSEKVPLIPSVPKTATWWTFPSCNSRPSRHKTYLMVTLNATPDSFSDGSDNNTVPAALTYATSSVAAGADIIDIGGYSTRPGAVYVSTEEELDRVVPVVQAIRALSATSDSDEDRAVKEQTGRTLLSVDTFRWEVAEAAVKAGANCINDVYSFTGRDYPVEKAGEEHLLKMRQVARDLAVPVVLMHSRGEASANKDYSQYAYAADTSGSGAVSEGIRVELGRKVDVIVKGKGGIRRWFVIVDPGIGFSKSVEGNVEILRHCCSITGRVTLADGARNPLLGYPTLIGASRKSFLGLLLEKPDPAGTYAGRKTTAKERDSATAAAVACAVQQGAAVIRVHDVLRLGDVVRVASELWS